MGTIPSRLLGALWIAAPLPAVLTGALLMQKEGVSSAVWLPQVGAALLFSVCCIGALIARPKPLSDRAWVAVAVVAVVLLATTLVYPGVEGVRRWIAVGPLQLHAAAVVLPILLLALGATRKNVAEYADRVVSGLALCAAVLLVLQPDPAQATAFAGGAAVLLLPPNRGRMGNAVVAILIVVSAAATWTKPDPLLAVPHVEGIVNVAVDAGIVWATFAIISLVLLPLPFVIGRHLAGAGAAIALAAYFSVLCIVPAAGAYPVPLLGFGLSPLLGYYIALGWLLLKLRAARPKPDWHFQSGISQGQVA